jgi:hypothetical protein
MKRLTSLVLVGALTIAVAAPVAASNFPEQSQIHSCAVVQSLPFDVVQHLFDIENFATGERLLDLVIDACNL